jgi:hypothetical protein
MNGKVIPANGENISFRVYIMNYEAVANLLK